MAKKLNPLEKSWAFGKEEGFTRVKDLIWSYETEKDEFKDLTKTAEESIKDIWDRKGEDVWRKHRKHKEKEKV